MLLTFEEAVALAPEMKEELEKNRVSRIHRDVLLKQYKTQWKAPKRNCCDNCKKGKIHRCSSCSKKRKLQNGTEK